jgi:hypothetical protein
MDDIVPLFLRRVALDEALGRCQSRSVCWDITEGAHSGHSSDVDVSSHDSLQQLGVAVGEPASLRLAAIAAATACTRSQTLL